MFQVACDNRVNGCTKVMEVGKDGPYVTTREELDWVKVEYDEEVVNTSNEDMDTCCERPIVLRRVTLDMCSKECLHQLVGSMLDKVNN